MHGWLHQKLIPHHNGFPLMIWWFWWNLLKHQDNFINQRLLQERQNKTWNPKKRLKIVTRGIIHSMIRGQITRHPVYRSRYHPFQDHRVLQPHRIIPMWHKSCKSRKPNWNHWSNRWESWQPCKRNQLTKPREFSERNWEEIHIDSWWPLWSDVQKYLRISKAVWIQALQKHDAQICQQFQELKELFLSNQNVGGKSSRPSKSSQGVLEKQEMEQMRSCRMMIKRWAHRLWNIVDTFRVSHFAFWVPSKRFGYVTFYGESVFIKADCWVKMTTYSFFAGHKSGGGKEPWTKW